MFLKQLLSALSSALETNGAAPIGKNMFIYSQETGRLWRPDGTLMYTGYSGYGEGKNNPEMQGVVNVGPIPRGVYAIGEAYDSGRVGPKAIPLNPVGHDALKRTDFRVHGDSIKNPGKASQGCVIMPRNVRKEIINSKDKNFLVIE